MLKGQKGVVYNSEHKKFHVFVPLWLFLIPISLCDIFTLITFFYVRYYTPSSMMAIDDPWFHNFLTFNYNKTEKKKNWQSSVPNKITQATSSQHPECFHWF